MALNFTHYYRRSLKSIAKWFSNENPLSEVVEAAIMARTKLAPQQTLDLVWIPGHRDSIQGNDLADTLANKGTKETITLLEQGERLMMEEAEGKAWERAQNHFNSLKKSRTLETIGAGYHKGRGAELKSTKMALTNIQTSTRLLWLGGYAFSKSDPIRYCSQCGDGVNNDTISYEAHLLLKCEILTPVRQILDIVKKDDDKDDWLMHRPGLDKLLQHLNTIRKAHLDERTQRRIAEDRPITIEEEIDENLLHPQFSLPEPATLLGEIVVKATRQAQELDNRNIDEEDDDDDFEQDEDEQSDWEMEIVETQDEGRIEESSAEMPVEEE